MGRLIKLSEFKLRKAVRDPLYFINEVIDWKPTPYQMRLIRKMQKLDKEVPQ